MQTVIWCYDYSESKLRCYNSESKLRAARRALKQTQLFNRHPKCSIFNLSQHAFRYILLLPLVDVKFKGVMNFAFDAFT